MSALIAKYTTVIGLSMFKFIFGPVTGASLGLSILETSLLTATGMMLTVVLITYGGTELRKKIMKRFFPNRRVFSPRNRKMVRLWKRYGMPGVAFLTPLLFSPIGGAVLAVSFGEKPIRIMVYMLASALFWGLFFSTLVIVSGKAILENI